MARIKITGVIDTDDLPSEHVDLEHSTGLTEEGFTKMGYTALAHLDDLSFELEKDEE